MDKPDFLGKRSLVRAAAAGLRQRLVGFTVEGTVIPEEGLQIVVPENGKREIVGWVTSSRFSPTLNRGIGLCWLPAAVAAENGAPFTIQRQGALLPAHVHHGAFYDPEGKRLRT
jgi:glycine cleavage system aminomethyltransferase T